MMINFCQSGHPVFRGSSAFERGDLKSKGKEKLSIHYNGSDETVEMFLRAVIAVNQLSVYGAVAVWRIGLRNLQKFKGYGETRGA